MKIDSTSQLNAELLIIVFTLVLVLLGATLIYFFTFIIKQKRQKKVIENELKQLKQIL